MNTYYIGGMPVTDELYHHGIIGQKWYVRRFQNRDGTLTPAGKKRYYGVTESTDTGGSGGSSRVHYKVPEYVREQEKLAKKVMSGRANIRNTPQVQHAVAELKDKVKDVENKKVKYVDEVNRFFNDERLADEYSGKAADKFLKDYPTVAEEYRNSRPLTSRFREMNDHDLIKWFIMNDDWGQGDYDPLTIFEDSNDKRARELQDADKAYRESRVNLSRSSRDYAKSFLGTYGDQEYTRAISGFPNGLKTKVEDTVRDVIYYSAVKKHTGKEYI